MEKVKAYTVMLGNTGPNCTTVFYRNEHGKVEVICQEEKDLIQAIKMGVILNLDMLFFVSNETIKELIDKYYQVFTREYGETIWEKTDM